MKSRLRVHNLLKVVLYGFKFLPPSYSVTQIVPECCAAVQSNNRRIVCQQAAAFHKKEKVFRLEAFVVLCNNDIQGILVCLFVLSLTRTHSEML